jgi:Domain of unknown function (DUF4352)
MATRPALPRLAGSIAAVVALPALVLLVLALAGRPKDGHATAGSSTPYFQSTHPATAPAHAGPTLPPDPDGTPVTLAGQYPDEQVTATVTAVVPDTQSFGNFAAPGPNARYAAAELTIVNSGNVNYTDVATTAATVVDSAGHIYPATIVGAVTAGRQLPMSLTLTPGQQVRGFVVFTVPKDATIAIVRYSMDAGYGQTGQWMVSSG